MKQKKRHALVSNVVFREIQTCAWHRYW